MKKPITYLFVFFLLSTLVSCSSFDKDIPSASQGVVASVESPAPGDEVRTKALDADFGFSFRTGDRITVFNGSGKEYMSYELTPSKGMADRASFNVEAFSLKDGLYYAVYPSLNSLPDPTGINLSLAGQTQTENGSTEHLAGYDYCLANAQIKDNSGYFKFEHKICWLKIVLPAGRNNNEFRKLTFSAGNGVAESITINAKTGAVTCERQEDDVLCLELGAGNGLQLDDSDTLVAYMCLPAGTYSDIVLTAESSSAYRSEFRYVGEKSFENGKYYLARIGETDIVPLEEITEFGVYDCDSDGRTMSWMPPVAKFRRGAHQMAWYSGSGITSFDFFELGTKDFASIRVNSDNLSVGQDYLVDIVSGVGTLCSAAAFKLVKLTDNTAWLFDSSDNLGCVIKINE